MTHGPASDDPLPLALAARRRGGGHVVMARGELDLGGVPDLLALIERVATRGAAVELDVQGLTFIDSTGVQGLADAVALARDHGAGAVTVRAPPTGPVARVLRLMGARARLPLALPP